MAKYPVSMQRQRGAVLAVAMILLVVMALIATAALRGTLLEARMAAGQTDRNFEFQAAEAALRAAGELIRADGTSSLGVDCKGPTNPGCGLPDDAGAVAGCGANCWKALSAAVRSDLAVGDPEYLIQRFDSLSTAEAYGLGNSAGTSNAGGGMASYASRGYYRVFARSHNPATRADRALVLLTATYAICLPGDASCATP